MEKTIILEDENGNLIEKISDFGILKKLLPDINDRNSYCLRYIDPYGDTVFNTLQMNDLINELKQLIIIVDTNEERNLLKDIIRMSKLCEENVHYYVKFYGD